MDGDTNKKRISINTDLFTSSTGKKKNKTLKKIKEPPQLKANSIKKALINKIKQKQKNLN